MRELFKDYGEINTVNMLNYRSDLSGKCFIEFSDVESANKAADALKESGIEFNGENLKVNMAREKNHPDSKSGRGDRTLWVGNIDFNAEEWKLEDFFSEFGEIDKISMPRD